MIYCKFGTMSGKGIEMIEKKSTKEEVLLNLSGK